ncbi:MAG: hypothetical protein WDO70_09860 [Alphaproteobacteria bacterium]
MLLAVCSSLAGCADETWINRFTGEPDAKKIGQNRSNIQRVDEQAAAWPNLASVPERPKDLPSPAARRQEREQLSRDREEALSLVPAKEGAPETK